MVKKVKPLTSVDLFYRRTKSNSNAYFGLWTLYRIIFSENISQLKILSDFLDFKIISNQRKKSKIVGFRIA
jgi:hypothetical protein